SATRGTDGSIVTRSRGRSCSSARSAVMIFVVEASGLRRCGRSDHSTLPVRASTRIAARALSGGVKRFGASGLAPTTRIGGGLGWVRFPAGLGTDVLGVPAFVDEV